MTSKKNHISNIVLNISQKFYGIENTLLYGHTILSKEIKYKINNQYTEKQYVSAINIK